MNLSTRNLIFIFVTSTSLFLGRSGQCRPESKWNYSLESQVTRCFRVKNVKIRCDSYVIPDTHDKISAELEILAVDVNRKSFAYGYGKSIEGGLCREHLTKILPLIDKQDQVCITGDGENQLNDGTWYARWSALETKLGRTEW